MSSSNQFEKKRKGIDFHVINTEKSAQKLESYFFEKGFYFDFYFVIRINIVVQTIRINKIYCCIFK